MKCNVGGMERAISSRVCAGGAVHSGAFALGLPKGMNPRRLVECSTTGRLEDQIAEGLRSLGSPADPSRP
jgi:hypothetical protein